MIDLRAQQPTLVEEMTFRSLGGSRRWEGGGFTAENIQLPYRPICLRCPYRPPEYFMILKRRYVCGFCALSAALEIWILMWFIVWIITRQIHWVAMFVMVQNSLAWSLKGSQKISLSVIHLCFMSCLIIKCVAGRFSRDWTFQIR